MSYRDMRTFTEMMRTLGYPRLISMENFRTPNFPLVAEILHWLIRRYNPSADLPLEVDTEQDRVIFIKSAAQLMASEAHVRLNTKKLYQADGYAVKELIKVTALLYGTMRHGFGAQGDGEDETEGVSTEADEILNSVPTKLSDLKQARKLATEITGKGALLYDLVGRESELREVRVTALNRQHNLDQVEAGIKAGREGLAREMERIVGQLGNIAADEANLEAKVEKRRQELERNQKRLSTLQAVRPAYFDDFERMEEELSVAYGAYLYRFRNLATLEAQYEAYSRLESERDEDVDSTLRKRAHEVAAVGQRVVDADGGGMDEFRAEEHNHIDLDDDDLDVSTASSGDDDGENGGNHQGRLMAGGGFNPLGAGGIRKGRGAGGEGGMEGAVGRPAAPMEKNFGGMDEPDDEDDDDEDDDDDDDDEDSDLDDDSDLELEGPDDSLVGLNDNPVGGPTAAAGLRSSQRPSGAGGKRLKPTRSTRPATDDSDNDF